jgi:hypothetical protein
MLSFETTSFGDIEITKQIPPLVVRAITCVMTQSPASVGKTRFGGSDSFAIKGLGNNITNTTWRALVLAV